MVAKEKITLTKGEQKQLELGKRMENMMELGYVNKKEALWFALLKGIVTGFGVFIGGTVVVTIVLWILSKIGHVPFITDLLN